MAPSLDDSNSTDSSEVSGIFFADHLDSPFGRVFDSMSQQPIRIRRLPPSSSSSRIPKLMSQSASAASAPNLLRHVNRWATRSISEIRDGSRESLVGLVEEVGQHHRTETLQLLNRSRARWSAPAPHYDPPTRLLLSTTSRLRSESGKSSMSSSMVMNDSQPMSNCNKPRPPSSTLPEMIQAAERAMARRAGRIPIVEEVAEQQVQPVQSTAKVKAMVRFWRSTVAYCRDCRADRRLARIRRYKNRSIAKVFVARRDRCRCHDEDRQREVNKKSADDQPAARLQTVQWSFDWAIWLAAMALLLRVLLWLFEIEADNWIR